MYYQITRKIPYISGSFVGAGWFLHLLGKGMFVFPTICSLSFHIEAPYQFLYVYEGILSITCENNTQRLSDRCAVLLPSSGDITIQIEKGRCRYFQMYLSGLSLPHYLTLLPEALRFPAESSDLFSLFTPWSICTNFRQILRKILCFYVKLPCGLPIF